MPLNKEQYDSIQKQYNERINRRQRLLQERKHEVYHKIPEYRKLDDAVPTLGMASLSRFLSGGDSKETLAKNKELLKQRCEQIREEKINLLVEAGYPADYLEIPYTCPDCKDTGYIGNEKCHCFKQAEIALLYRDSHVNEHSRKLTFDDMSDQYYQGDDRTRFVNAKSISCDFVKFFKNRYQNLYFYGTVGTGKTLLSVCIANALIEQGYSVIYFSACALFDRLSACSFGERNKTPLQELNRDLYGCDLLIIDDLGTELTNSFVTSQLFTILNERQLNRKSTVISTNLSLEELQSRYSDRIFSRITSQYELCKFSGQDIRIQQLRLRHQNPSNS